MVTDMVIGKGSITSLPELPQWQTMLGQPSHTHAPNSNPTNGPAPLWLPGKVERPISQVLQQVRGGACVQEHSEGEPLRGMTSSPQHLYIYVVPGAAETTNIPMFFDSSVV